MTIWRGTNMPLCCAYGPSSPTCGAPGDSLLTTHAAPSFAHRSGTCCHSWPRAAGFPFRGNETDTFGCPAGTVDCRGSSTSVAQGHDTWHSDATASSAAWPGQCHSSKMVYEPAWWGWREGDAMSPLGLSAQRHWFMWDHARSRSRAGEVLLLPPPALPMILVKQLARGILTAPQQHNQCPGARLQQIQGAAPVQAER